MAGLIKRTTFIAFTFCALSVSSCDTKDPITQVRESCKQIALSTVGGDVKLNEHQDRLKYYILENLPGDLNYTSAYMACLRVEHVEMEQ